MHRVTAFVVTTLLMTGCGVGDRFTLGERAEFIVPSTAPAAADQYGTSDVALLRVTRGQPTPAGTPYHVTIGFADGTPREVTAIDSTGAAHAPTSIDADRWVFVLPPGTELVGFELGDEEW